MAEKNILTIDEIADDKRKVDIREVTEYILAIPKFAEKIGTEDLRHLMELLGNPQDKPLSIHVAGTNGKGSTTEMLRCMLTEAGLRTGSFTSPHLVRINERIALDGQYISDEDFIECFRTVMKAIVENDLRHPSFFEFIFAVAAVYFEKIGADAVVYETGMGGRLDATNIITPEVSVITSIGMDHMQYLGDTVEKIAFEKAGIIKNGIPVVHNMCAPDGDRTAEDLKHRAARVIKERAEALDAPLTIVDRVDSRLTKWIDQGRLINPAFDIIYQLENATAALKALEIFNEKNNILSHNNDKIMVKALQAFNMPARMEKLRKNVIIDGAHNQDAVPRFIQGARSIIKKEKPAGVKLMFAVSSDKDYTSMIEMLCNAGIFDTVYITTFDSYRKTSVDVVKELFRKFAPEGRNIPIYSIPDLKECLDSALDTLNDDELLFSVGSLYLAGEVKAYMQSR
ncbi:MAG: bifunctional folylpolyglutamate synthase/dihydrofolate synthase [Eubacterium sp.]|nr:bifunctional folylpolyglutamate synthase/dihydrofolate synthase [Eubacterium sp.]